MLSEWRRRLVRVPYTVGQVARLSGVTIRTLHHYDAVGLLSPSKRAPTGYRLYTDDDLEQLQQVLLYRELGFALDSIAEILSQAGSDRTAHLRRQHTLLCDRISQLQAMAAAVQRVLEAHQMGIAMTPEERTEVFGAFRPEEYAAESEQRWGDTDAWRQSQRRTAGYGKPEWQLITEQSGAIERGLAQLLTAGEAPDSEAAMDLAEQHRQHITRWFYDCSYEIHRGLAEMYLADGRFSAHYDASVPGLARYLRDAIVANAERAEATPSFLD
jgi:MerR family transcriptional regulator, thiopeptide resistance regulator